MTTSEHPPSDPAGWELDPCPATDPRDRNQASLYRVEGLDAATRLAGGFSAADRYALENRLWVAERIVEDRRARLLPLEDRPGIRRLVYLAMAAGGAVVESWNDLGDDRDQAAVGLYFRRISRPLGVAGGPTPAKELDRTIARAGGEHSVRPMVGQLRAIRVAALEQVREVVYPLGRIGDGGPREYPDAVAWAHVLASAGCSQREIRDRLNLDGYLNLHGRRLWNTHNTPSFSR